MKPRIHVITLAVEDLYRNLGLEPPGDRWTRMAGGRRECTGAIATFRLCGGLILGLHPRNELAQDAGIPRPARARAHSASGM